MEVDGLVAVAIVCEPLFHVVLLSSPCHMLHVALHFPTRLQ